MAVILEVLLHGMVWLLTMKFFALILVAAYLLAPTLTAQVGGESTLLRTFAMAPGFEAETPTVGLGDLNGDGIGELLIGAPGANGGAGRATVQSGADGAVIYQYSGSASGWNGSGLGRAVANAGDQDGDGFDDFFVSEPGGLGGSGARGYVHLYSGASGALIQTIPAISTGAVFGWDLAMLSDLDGDGRQELIVGDNRGTFQTGAVHVFASASSSLLFTMNGEGVGDAFGASVADAGDVDNDGKADILVGAEAAALGKGAAYVFSGADGSLLRRYVGAATSDRFGHDVGGLGDIDADGHADVLISATYADRGSLQDSGTVYAISGRTSNILWVRKGDREDGWLGSSLAVIEDLDSDMLPDVLVGAHGVNYPGLPDAGAVWWLSGATGELIHSIEGSQSYSAIGYMVSSVGDLDQDGYEDVVINRSNYALDKWVDAFSFHPFLRSDLPTASVSVGGTAHLELDFPDAAAYEYKVLFSKTGNSTSVYGVEIPLTQDYLTVDSYRGNYPMPTTNLHGALGPNGDATASFIVPAGLPSAMVGQTFWLAAIAAQPGQLPEYSSIAIALEITL